MGPLRACFNTHGCALIVCAELEYAIFAISSHNKTFSAQRQRTLGTCGHLGKGTGNSRKLTSTQVSLGEGGGNIRGFSKPLHTAKNWKGIFEGGYSAIDSIYNRVKNTRKHYPGTFLVRKKSVWGGGLYPVSFSEFSRNLKPNVI